MKKITSTIIALSIVILFSSCGTTGQGALSGAFIGSSVGGAIGGITGGYYGHDVGTLVGMAVGATSGAVIGAANEQQRYEEIRAYHNNTARRAYRRAPRSRYYSSRSAVADDTYRYSSSSAYSQNRSANTQQRSSYYPQSQQSKGYTIGTQTASAATNGNPGFHIGSAGSSASQPYQDNNQQTVRIGSQHSTADDSGFDPNHGGDDRIDFE